MSDSLHTLVLPLVKDLIPLPADGDLLFLGAELSAALASLPRARLWCEQPVKPLHDALAASGFQVAPRLDRPAGSAALALVHLGKNRDENRLLLARAYALLAVGGTLLVAGANEIGASRYEKDLGALFPDLQSLSKHKARVFWLYKPAGEAPAPLRDWLSLDGLSPILRGRWLSCTGLFGWDKVDAGSELLIRHIPAKISGRVADLGAGWGYLSLELLAQYPAVSEIELFEADHRALLAAEANLRRADAPSSSPADDEERVAPVTIAPAPVAEGTKPRWQTHWSDVTQLAGPRRFDVVVTNPPFHEGKEERRDLGQDFIRAAARILRPHGLLVLVANRHLPYEATLAESFSKVERLADEGGYKVLRAQLTGPVRH